MLQSGVGTRDLDVRWVSSLSWYFLTLFGLQPVYNFILGSDNCKFTLACIYPAEANASAAANQMAQQMAQMNPAANLMGPGNDPDKLFQSEAENLEVIEHEYILDGIEDRLLASLS